ncbi:MAG: SCO1664 family protein [Actinobacteria bacterium]|nr:MAG: SCO1664 family protein [Actinomycetota bacterium]
MQLTAERVKTLLREGDVEILGLLPGASNYTFAVTVADPELKVVAVYKPQAGETPLWDFADGTLWRREIAAYELSEALGWSLVPPTVERDGPEGIGSMQLYIEHDPEQHYFTLMPEHAATFMRVALLDHVMNNADRKAGHCLLEMSSKRVWVVDHGVCFHADPKLRTVIWDFAGEPIPVELLIELERADLGVLRPWLTAYELDVAMKRRTELLAARAFPAPPEDRRAYPWPPV